MKLLHTSDWHLGRRLYGRQRYQETAAFLDWLLQCITEQDIDLLIIAGDVFDTSTPGHIAQEQYYGFLSRVAAAPCRHVVIIAGNHDSSAFLDAPKGLLHALNVQVIGSVTDTPGDEVFLLRDSKQQPMAIVCAVPYLRDRDIRHVQPGESMDDKHKRMVDGITQHYAAVADVARKIQQQEEGAGSVPVIATGHVFAAGSATVEGDGVRELYVGSLAHVRGDVFPELFDYVALGHLHQAQIIGGKTHIRYSGSPLAMGFAEAGQEKVVLAINFAEKNIQVDVVPIPCFQELVVISGTLEQILAEIARLIGRGSEAWLELRYTGDALVENLNEIVHQAITGSSLEIRRVRNSKVATGIINQHTPTESLADLALGDVFSRYLESHSVIERDRPELLQAYNEIVADLEQRDGHEEMP